MEDGFQYFLPNEQPICLNPLTSFASIFFSESSVCKFIFTYLQPSKDFTSLLKKFKSYDIYGNNSHYLTLIPFVTQAPMAPKLSMSRPARITLLLVIDIIFFFVELIVGKAMDLQS